MFVLPAPNGMWRGPRSLVPRELEGRGLWGSGTHMASNSLWEGTSGGDSPVGHLWDDVMPILVI